MAAGLTSVADHGRSRRCMRFWRCWAQAKRSGQAGVWGACVHQRAIDWVLRTTGEQSTATYRLRQWLLGISGSSEWESPGWPWTIGAAEWVGPTTIAILALEQEELRNPSARIRERMAAG